MSRNFPSFQEQIVGAPLAHQHRLHSLLLQRRWNSNSPKVFTCSAILTGTSLKKSHYRYYRYVEMLQHSILAEQLAAGISRLKVVVSTKSKT